MTSLPNLTSRYGVRPVSAAQAIVSFSPPGRSRTEATYAALGGTSPIAAISGKTIRHRLNRGGVPVLRDMITRPDTPLDNQARERVVTHLSQAAERFAAIRPAGQV